MYDEIFGVDFVGVECLGAELCGEVFGGITDRLRARDITGALNEFLLNRSMQNVTPNSAQGTVYAMGKPVSPRALDRLYIANIWYEGGGWVRGTLDKRFAHGTPVPESEIPKILGILYQQDLKRERDLRNPKGGFLRKGLVSTVGATVGKGAARDAVQNVVRTATVSDAVRGVIRNPALKAMGTVAAIAFPPAGAIAGAVIAADKLASAAAKKDPRGIVNAALEVGGNLGSAADTVAGAGIIQAASPMLKAPVDVINAASKGATNAVQAAQKFLALPGAAKEFGALALEIPDFRPNSAESVAAVEAVSRLLDALNSGKPEVVARAAMQRAATEAMSKKYPGAARAVNLLKEVSAGRKLVGDAAKNVPQAKNAILKLKKAALQPANKKAKTGFGQLQTIAAREAVHGRLPKDAVHKLAVGSPTLLSLVQMAKRTPSGVRLGDWSVLATGRILHKGKPIRKVPAKKGFKAPAKKKAS